MYKLLVADDEQKDRNIVRLLVEKQYGDLFEILEAKSGTQALEILRNDQIDLLQQYFGPIIEAKGYKDNRGGLYEAEDTVSACFRFDSGLPGSGSWCFVAHESAREDRIEIIGDRGLLSFSVFTYEPIVMQTERGREEFVVPNPEHVQLPMIQSVVEHLQGLSICSCDSVSATSVNWVIDRILGKF